MRILQVADAQSVHTRRWAEAFRDRGADVHVASFRRASIEGVVVHALPTGGFGKAGYFFAVPVLRRLAAKVRPDVVHAQYVTSYGFLAAIAGLKPLVVTAWGTDILLSPRESRLARAFARRALSRADQVTTVADHMIAAAVALGAPAERVTTVPFGVDTALFRPPDVQAPAPPPLRLICTRNFGPIYDVATLVEAARRLHDGGMDIALDLVGQGALRAALERQVEAAGLAGRTTFHGHVDHARLVSLLGASHIFVSPALSDGNNVSLNEAMACGTFPIVTDIPANRQWIDDGDNGLHYAAGDAGSLAAAIGRVAADARWRERAATVNRAIVEQRADWCAQVERMAAIYARAAIDRPPMNLPA